MSNIMSQITIGDIRIIIADSIPSIGSGLTAEIGSLLIVEGQGGIYIKTGPQSTDWKLSTVDAEQLTQDLQSFISRLDSLESNSVTQEYLDTELTEIRTEISEEVTRATAAEDQIRSDLVSEEIRATQAETDLDSRIMLLEQDPVTKTYVDSVKSNLQDQIDYIKSNFDMAAIDSLTEVVAAFQAADSNINNAIMALGTSASSALGQEVSRAIAAESQLRTDISSEVTARELAISNVQIDINNEASFRQAADEDLSSRIDSEVEAREIADEELSDKIDLEIATRQSETLATRSLISDEEASRIAGDASTLASSKQYADQQDSIKLAEAKAYSDQKIAELINGAPAILDTLKEISDQLMYDESAVAALVATVASNLQTAKDYSDAAVLVEKTRAELEEADLQSQISQEISDREAAVFAEQSRAQAEEATLMKVDGSRPMSGDLDMDGHSIKNASSVSVGVDVKFKISTNIVQTISNESSEISSIVMESPVELLKVMITGLDPQSLDSVSYERTARLKKINGVASIHMIQSDYTSEDSSLSSANCSFDVSGSNVSVKVKGVNSVPMNWKCVVQKMS